MSLVDQSRYFLALVPQGPLQALAQQLKQEIADLYTVKAALRSPAHITLHMPFEWKATKEAELLAVLENFRYPHSFTVQVKDFGCFEPRVVFLSVEDSPLLRDLQDQLVYHVKRHLGLFNQADDRRGFHPHITLAFRDLKKEAFYSLWADCKDKPFQASFVASSFCLLRHEQGAWHVFREFPFGSDVNIK